MLMLLIDRQQGSDCKPTWICLINSASTEGDPPTALFSRSLSNFSNFRSSFLNRRICSTRSFWTSMSTVDKFSALKRLSMLPVPLPAVTLAISTLRSDKLKNYNNVMRLSSGQVTFTWRGFRAWANSLYRYACSALLPAVVHCDPERIHVTSFSCIPYCSYSENWSLCP